MHSNDAHMSYCNKYHTNTMKKSDIKEQNRNLITPICIANNIKDHYNTVMGKVDGDHRHHKKNVKI